MHYCRHEGLATSTYIDGIIVVFQDNKLITITQGDEHLLPPFFVFLKNVLSKHSMILLKKFLIQLEPSLDQDIMIINRTKNQMLYSFRWSGSF